MGKEAIWIRQEQGWEEIQSYWKFEIHTKNPSVCKDIYWKCTSYNLKVSSSFNQCYVMKHILIFLNHRVLDALFTDYQNWNMLGSRFSLTFSADISQPININYRSALTSPLPLPAFVLSSIPFSISPLLHILFLWFSFNSQGNIWETLCYHVILNNILRAFQLNNCCGLVLLSKTVRFPAIHLTACRKLLPLHQSTATCMHATLMPKFTVIHISTSFNGNLWMTLAEVLAHNSLFWGRTFWQRTGM